MTASLRAQEGYPCDKAAALPFHGPVEIAKDKSGPSKHSLQMAKITALSFQPHCTVWQQDPPRADVNAAPRGLEEGILGGEQGMGSAEHQGPARQCRGSDEKK